MAWTKPGNYSKNDINKAGQTLIGAIWTAEREEALEIINNYRSSHAYPLHIATKTLKKRATKIDEDAFVAQRLKRLASVTAKLERFPTMQLSRMQDIAGCRTVMNDVFQVEKLRDTVCDAYAGTLGDYRLYDYIYQPKSDGYRSVHIVGRYRSGIEANHIYDGLQIEIQIRSRLQHAWATAVETVSAFTGQQLKSNIGKTKWKRFFALMGSAIAILEECPLVPQTPTAPKELVYEIRELDRELAVLTTLGGFNVAVRETEGVPNARIFILELNAEKETVNIYKFSSAQAKLASKTYLELEQEYASENTVQVVMVSVDSLATLRSAYPNYYLDTTEFLRIVKEVVEIDI